MLFSAGWFGDAVGVIAILMEVREGVCWVGCFFGLIRYATEVALSTK